MVLSYFLKKKKRFYLSIFRQRGREGWKHQCVVAFHAPPPHQGPGPQTRHTPRLGIKLATRWFTGRHSIHWATPARAVCFFCLNRKQKRKLAPVSHQWHEGPRVFLSMYWQGSRVSLSKPERPGLEGQSPVGKGGRRPDHTRALLGIDVGDGPGRRQTPPRAQTGESYRNARYRRYCIPSCIHCALMFLTQLFREKIFHFNFLIQLLIDI